MASTNTSNTSVTWDLLEHSSIGMGVAKNISTKMLTTVTILLAVYTGAQTVWHSPEWTDFIQNVAEKMWQWVVETAKDIADLAMMIIDSPEIFTGAFQEDIPHNTQDAALSFMNDQQAESNNPLESLATVSWIWVSTAVLNFLIRLKILKDSLELQQRLRFKITNKSRSPEASRVIIIPETGWDTFKRK
jgi:hypothetical protein